LSNVQNTTAAAQPFPSLAALRAAHTELLKRCQRDGYGEAELAQAAVLIQRGVAAGALLDDEVDRDAAQSLLDYWSTILIRADQEAPDSTLAEFDPNEAPELPDAAAPYRGLDPFGEPDRDAFYGRRRLVEWLVAKLETQRMLALVGPSGSGKSSVVRAGLLPALKDGALAGSASWRYLPPFTPGPDPFDRLVRQVRRAGFAGADAVQPGALRDEPAGLARLLDGAGAPVLVFIDQFEELFTLCEDEATRQAFVEALIGLVDDAGVAHMVILTMRSDFESFIATTPALQALFERTRVQLMPLNAAELREAIEKPAELVGLKFEPGVVDALLHDMLGEPAALPLLQFTLLKLWEQRDRNRVTWEAYRRVGGGRLALARSADALYNSLLPEDQVTARRILLRIVRPGEGLEITSNPVRREALYQGGEARDRVDRVLGRLVGARLLRLTEGDTPETAQVELAHEALVRNWPTLVQWLEDERAAVATRRRLEAKASEWVRLGRGTAGLLDEGQLVEAERWLASAEAAYLGYDPALADLVRASNEALVLAEQQRKAAEQRELRQAQELAEALAVQKEQAVQLADAARVQADQARKLAETQRAAALRARGLAVALALMFGVVLAVAIFAGQQWLTASAALQSADAYAATAQSAADLRATEAVALQTAEAESRANFNVAATRQVEAVAAEATAVAERQRAERESRAARSGQLAAQARAEADARPQLALLLAVEALNVTRDAGEPPVPVAQETLRGELGRIGGRGLFGHDGAVTALAVSADGTRLVTGGAEGSLLLWKLDAPGEAPQRLAAPAPVTMLELSADGRWLATSDAAPETARLWDLADPAAAPRELIGHQGPINDMTMSADGRFVATASDDGSVRVWRTDGPAPVVVLSSPSRRSPLLAVALSSDAEQIVAGGQDGISRLWRRSAPTSAGFTRDPRRALTTAAISPNGRWFVTGSADGDAHFWQIANGSFQAGPVVLRGRGIGISKLAVSPDSRLIAFGANDGTVRLWEVSANRTVAPVSELRGHQGRITALAFSPDSTRLLTASTDNVARLWDLSLPDPGTAPVILRGHEGAINAAAISADGRFAITGSADTSARVWQLANAAPNPDTLPTDPAELIPLACEVAGRSMSQEEWERYLPGQPFRATCSAG
jgi:WD40 repeat protein/energy-coupling factor transporter ATP-binding protein EcfA2